MVDGDENVNIYIKNTKTWVSTLKDDNVDKLYHLMTSRLCRDNKGAKVTLDTPGIEVTV